MPSYESGGIKSTQEKMFELLWSIYGEASRKNIFMEEPKKNMGPLELSTIFFEARRKAPQGPIYNLFNNYSNQIEDLMRPFNTEEKEYQQQNVAETTFSKSVDEYEQVNRERHRELAGKEKEKEALFAGSARMTRDDAQKNEQIDAKLHQATHKLNNLENKDQKYHIASTSGKRFGTTQNEMYLLLLGLKDLSDGNRRFARVLEGVSDTMSVHDLYKLYSTACQQVSNQVSREVLTAFQRQGKQIEELMNSYRNNDAKHNPRIQEVEQFSRRVDDYEKIYNERAKEVEENGTTKGTFFAESGRKVKDQHERKQKTADRLKKSLDKLDSIDADVPKNTGPSQ
jgi:hypothetical protein